MRNRYCHLCGRRLQGRGWVYTTNGTAGDQALVICRDCHENARRCALCGLPLSAASLILPDGRQLCHHCAQNVVCDLAQARVLFGQVIDIVAGRLGLHLRIGADLTLADSHHLRQLAEQMRPEERIPPEQVIGLFIRKGRRRVMYVLSGLPQILFIQTVAHEWAHAWQGENCPLLKDPRVYEGFAEWVAYHTLLALGAVKAAARLAQRQGLYGDGLRDLLAREQTSGAPAVLAFCRQSE